MRAYLANLTPTIRMLLAVPALVLAYTLVTCVLPAMVRAVVPDAVRSVLSLL
jgi:ABC-type sulfate transport system permease subunit